MPFEENPKDSFHDDERSALTELQVDPLHSVSQLQKTRREYRIIITLTKSIVILLAVYGCMTLTLHTFNFIRDRKTANATNICDCGNSVSEAKAMGCKFSTLASAWLPEVCRDDNLEEEFYNAGPHGGWKYWHDANGTQEIGPDELGFLSEGGGYYWTTQRWHITHCVYYWLKNHRKSNTGVVVEQRYTSEGHIRHCLKVMLLPLDLDFISTYQGASLTSG